MLQFFLEVIQLLIVSDGDATCNIKDSEGFLNVCHVFLNGLRGLKLELVKLVCRLPDIAILCSVNVIVDDFKPLNRIVLGKKVLDQVVEVLARNNIKNNLKSFEIMYSLVNVIRRDDLVRPIILEYKGFYRISSGVPSSQDGNSLLAIG